MRRAADLEGHREADRERQRESRRRRREKARSEPEKIGGAVAPAALSRAEFAAQVHAITSIIVKNVDKAASLSRAEFERQVVKIVKEGVQILGKACA